MKAHYGNYSDKEYFLGEIRLPKYCEATLALIFENLHKVFGFEEGIWRECEEGSSSEEETVSFYEKPLCFFFS